MRVERNFGVAFFLPVRQKFSRNYVGFFSYIQQWVDEVAARTCPETIHWCTGSDDEYQQLIEKMTAGRSSREDRCAVRGCDA